MSERTTAEVAVKNRMALPEFRAGKEGPSIFSAGTMNIMSRALKALTNPHVSWGEKDDAQITDGNFNITLSRASVMGGAIGLQFVLKSVQGDYVTAHAWDGFTEFSDNILIAKEYKARCSLTGETIFGVEHAYTYANGPDSLNVLRTNNDGTHSETEIIVPPWTLNERLYATQVVTDVPNTVAGGLIKLLMVGRSAQWAKYP